MKPDKQVAAADSSRASSRSVRARTGKNPAKDVYTVRVPTTQRNITGFVWKSGTSQPDGQSLSRPRQFRPHPLEVDVSSHGSPNPQPIKLRTAVGPIFAKATTRYNLIHPHRTRLGGGRAFRPATDGRVCV